MNESIYLSICLSIILVHTMCAPKHYLKSVSLNACCIVLIPQISLDFCLLLLIRLAHRLLCDLSSVAFPLSLDLIYWVNKKLIQEKSATFILLLLTSLTTLKFTKQNWLASYSAFIRCDIINGRGRDCVLCHGNTPVFTWEEWGKLWGV
jgi:hypothetical protein